MNVKQTLTALTAGIQASFQGYGGVEPYVYSLAPNGPGGTIDANTGIYTAPLELPENPKNSIETIIVTDANAETVEATLLVTSPLGLFCEIIQKELDLDDDQVYFWDQKIEQPKDDRVYISVGILTSEPFGNANRSLSGSGLEEILSVNIKALLSIDIISRGPGALYKKDELVLAFNSNYAQSQQEINSFYIGKLTPRFLNLSPVDGAAIPYRFNVNVNIQYFVKKIKAIPYFDTFEYEVETES